MTNWQFGAQAFENGIRLHTDDQAFMDTLPQIVGDKFEKAWAADCRTWAINEWKNGWTDAFNDWRKNRRG